MTKVENSLFKATIVPENSRSVDDITSVVVVSELENFNWCSGCEKLKTELDELRSEHHKLIKKSNRDSQLVILNDLNRIYRYHIADSILKDCFQYDKWETFVQEVCSIKSQLEDDEITVDMFNNFINPFVKAFNLNILSLIEHIKERHNNCHSNIKSKSNQRRFIETVNNIDFDDDLKPLVVEMLDQLRGVKLTSI